jgi:hypothetical protein
MTTGNETKTGTWPTLHVLPTPDIDWNLVSKLNERGTHTPQQSFHVVVFFVCHWPPILAVDKEKKRA